jgi:4-diphosphocytidyl-2-C-methyl-D-erythritol kinase
MPDTVPGPGSLRSCTAEAPAKINLALAVLGRRADGYHDIRTVFQAVDLADTLHVSDRREEGIALTVTGREWAPEGPENLVVRMGEALSRRHAPGRGARIVLEKRIPAGAGLGGGSSDAAAALLALERVWELELTAEARHRLALEIGSDVPFFLHGGTIRGEGRGEILTPLPPPPPAHWALILPDIRVSTARAYAEVSRSLTNSANQLTMLELALVQADSALLAENFVNDLEAGVLRIEPGLTGLKAEVASVGVVAGLSGSGSALFAMARRAEQIRRLQEWGRTRPGVRVVPCVLVGHGVRLRGEA